MSRADCLYVHRGGELNLGRCFYNASDAVFPQAKYAYRSIAQFVTHVKDSSEEHLERNPFPQLHRSLSQRIPGPEPEHQAPSASEKNASYPDGDQGCPRSDVELYRANKAKTDQEVLCGDAEKLTERRGPSNTGGESKVRH